MMKKRKILTKKLDLRSVLVRVPTVKPRSRKILRKEDWKILELCDGKRDIKTIIQESKIPKEKAIQCIDFLINTGFIFTLNKQATEKK